MKKFVSLFILAFLFLPFFACARVGVGINTGTIQMPQPLKAGGIYELPEFAIINTGDETSEYKIGVEYYTGQPELLPPRDWFRFEPPTFYLEKGKGQTIKTKIVVPLKAKPGDYFAYVEGRPLARDIVTGGVTIGVAAATKLYFTVAPANIFLAIYHRAAAIFNVYYPWSLIVLIILGLAVFIVIFKKFFKFQIGVSRK